MTRQLNDRKLSILLSELELPDSAYETATKRYEDLGTWFSRDESLIFNHDPHVLVQGSFALGTAIRPVFDDESYDLDITCKLRQNIQTNSHSQSQLKELLGSELEAYRKARGIKHGLEEKHRCWRIEYRDDLNFHIDVMPCIPTSQSQRQALSSVMEQAGLEHSFATEISAESILITDDRNANYRLLDVDWPSSNPEGYIQWFKSKLERPESRGLLMEAQIDDIPLFKRKSKLQQVIQVLKRHRDVMFKEHKDSKPISIIISTLAAHYYRPGESLADSLNTILEGLQNFCASNSDIVPNPTDPRENFADRWHRPEYQHLQLKTNFHNWVRQAKNDFSLISELQNPEQINEHFSRRFQAENTINKLAPIMADSTADQLQPKTTQINDRAPRPWRATD